MRKISVFLFVIPVSFWIAINILDGLMTPYKSILTGREMCNRFLYGYEPTGHASDHFVIWQYLFGNLDWHARRVEPQDLFETCRISFHWEVRDPFYGVLRIWLTKTDEAGNVETTFTGGHANYHLYTGNVSYRLLYHRINLTGVMSSTRWDRDDSTSGIKVWEEIYEREGSTLIDVR
ncbi:MAG: hypothetical protein ACPG1C_02500 [Alphaproteobacteria bacterium]